MFRLVAVIVVASTLGACGRRDTYFEDENSHSVKVQRGLLGKEEVVFVDPSFDAKNAKWVKGVTLAARSVVKNGDVFVVSVEKRLFAVEVSDQNAQPERVTYRWKEIGSVEIRKDSGQNIVLAGIEIKWSFFSKNEGRIYCEPFFLASKSSYEIGSPYLQKRLEDVEREDVQTLRFSRFPWDI